MAFIDHFSGPGIAIGLVCVCVDNNFRTKLLKLWHAVHLYTILVKFNVSRQDRRSEFKAIGENVAKVISVTSSERFLFFQFLTFYSQHLSHDSCKHRGVISTGHCRAEAVNASA